MDWTDTMMLEPTPRLRAYPGTTAEVSHGGEGLQQQTVAGPSIKLADPEHATSSTRVITVQGVTLLHSDGGSRQELVAALESLRDFRAVGRRVVLCDTTELVVGRQFGCSLVEQGQVEVLVSCGRSGREIAIGARDAGLALADVVVCGRSTAASEVLSHRLAPGDTVLLLGVREESCNHIVAVLEQRLSLQLKAA